MGCMQWLGEDGRRLANERALFIYCRMGLPRRQFLMFTYLTFKDEGWVLKKSAKPTKA